MRSLTQHWALFCSVSTNSLFLALLFYIALWVFGKFWAKEICFVGGRTFGSIGAVACVLRASKLLPVTLYLVQAKSLFVFPPFLCFKNVFYLSELYMINSSFEGCRPLPWGKRQSRRLQQKQLLHHLPSKWVRCSKCRAALRTMTTKNNNSFIGNMVPLKDCGYRTALYKLLD